MYYTIRVNSVIAAKCESATVAAVIANLYGADKEVKIINNIFKRICFNNRRQEYSVKHIIELVEEKDEQFRQDYNRNIEEFLEK